MSDRLIRAINQNLPGAVQKVLRTGVEINYDHLCSSPLVIAAKMQDLIILKILLEYGANPNFIPSLGCGPLSAAADKFNTEAIALLLKHGANPNLEYGEPLVRSAKHRNIKAVELLLEHGADPNSKGIFVNSSPLHEVARLGAHNPEDLLHAPWWGLKVVEVDKLFQGSKRHKARKQAKDKIYNEYIEIGIRIAVKVIEAGASINNDSDGFGTPLHEAAESNYDSMLMALLAKGASPYIKNGDGETVMEILDKGGLAALITIAKTFSELSSQ